MENHLLYLHTLSPHRRIYGLLWHCVILDKQIKIQDRDRLDSNRLKGISFN